MADPIHIALVEAGAVKMYELDGGRPEIWDNIGDEMRRIYREKSAAVIDTFLDTLADRGDEWADSGREFDTISSAGNVTDKGYVFRLIAVLREGDG